MSVNGVKQPDHSAVDAFSLFDVDAGEGAVLQFHNGSAGASHIGFESAAGNELLLFGQAAAPLLVPRSLTTDARGAQRRPALGAGLAGGRHMALSCVSSQVTARCVRGGDWKRSISHRASRRPYWIALQIHRWLRTPRKKSVRTPKYAPNKMPTA